MGRRIHTGQTGYFQELSGIQVIDSTVETILTDSELIFKPDGVGKVRVAKDTDSTDSSTGSMVIEGGLGIVKNLNVDGVIGGNGRIDGGSF